MVYCSASGWSVQPADPAERSRHPRQAEEAGGGPQGSVYFIIYLLFFFIIILHETFLESIPSFICIT